MLVSAIPLTSALRREPSLNLGWHTLRLLPVGRLRNVYTSISDRETTAMQPWSWRGVLFMTSPTPHFAAPPRDRERAAVVSTLVVVVVSDSSPPHSEIDPHFYLSQTFEESNTKRFAQSDNRNTWQEFFGLLGLREARPIRAARGEVQFTWTGSRHVSWKPKKFSVSPLWGKFST